VIRTTFSIALLMCSILASRANAQPPEFRAPWEDGKSAIVIDPYAENTIDWDELETDQRVAAVIHKATEGFDTDPLYASRKQEASKRGYLWGSYHLGRPGDPVKQADHYLAAADPSNDDLIALDLEQLGSGFMSLANAEAFVARVAERTHRYPLLYVDHATATTLSKSIDGHDVLARCPLWYARYRRIVTDFPKKPWSSYALWQFSSEINCHAQGKCPYNVPGTRYDIDVNVYFGTRDDLERAWPLTRVEADPSQAGESK